MKKTVRSSGFTLVELLVVITIISVLAVVVALIINPAEIIRRSRDADRVTDLANLQQAINVGVQEATDSGAAILCNGGSFPCTGKSNTGSRLVNGTGWISVNIGGVKAITMPTLPVDPINDTAFHYTYCADKDAWELDAKLESEQMKSKMVNDGGDEDGLFESGSNLNLINAESGASCTYN